MKRVFAVLLAAVLVLSLTACGNKKSEHDAIVKNAVVELKKKWQESYDTDAINGMETDRYLEIKNTKVITIKRNAIAEFQAVAYLIEFELISDYLGTAPDYQETKVLNNVLVYLDGHMEVQSNVIDHYKHKNSKEDVTYIIESTEDCRDAYNWAGKLK